MSEHGIDAEAPAYSYKPALFRAPYEFRLLPAAVSFTIGAQSGHIAYRDIRRLRLGFRPTSAQSARYLAEVWPASGPKVQIASTSRRTMIDSDRHDAAYAAFVRDLASRVAAANPTLAVELGTAPVVYWPGLVVFGVLAVAILALAVRAVEAEQWSGAAIIIGFWALFLWQIGLFFWRNRPRTCGGGRVPDDILPPGASRRT